MFYGDKFGSWIWSILFPYLEIKVSRIQGLIRRNSSTNDGKIIS